MPEKSTDNQLTKPICRMRIAKIWIVSKYVEDILRLRIEWLEETPLLYQGDKLFHFRDFTSTRLFIEVSLKHLQSFVVLLLIEVELA
jgi:hypothetical protein